MAAAGAAEEGGRRPRARGRRRLGVNVSFMGDDDEVVASGRGNAHTMSGPWKAKGVESTPSRFFNGGKKKAAAPGGFGAGRRRTPLSPLESNCTAAEQRRSDMTTCETEAKGDDEEASRCEEEGSRPDCTGSGDVEAPTSPPPPEQEAVRPDGNASPSPVADVCGTHVPERIGHIQSPAAAPQIEEDGGSIIEDQAEGIRDDDVDDGAMQSPIYALLHAVATLPHNPVEEGIDEALCRLRDEHAIDAGAVLRALRGLATSVERAAAAETFGSAEPPAAAESATGVDSGREEAPEAEIVLRPELFTESTIAKRRSRSFDDERAGARPAAPEEDMEAEEDAEIVLRPELFTEPTIAKRRSCSFASSSSSSCTVQPHVSGRRSGAPDPQTPMQEEEEQEEEEEEEEQQQEEEEEQLEELPDAAGTASGFSTGGADTPLAGPGPVRDADDDVSDDEDFDDDDIFVSARRRGADRRGGRMVLTDGESSEECSPTAMGSNPCRASPGRQPPAGPSSAAVDTLADELRSKLSAVSSDAIQDGVVSRGASDASERRAPPPAPHGRKRTSDPSATSSSSEASEASGASAAGMNFNAFVKQNFNDFKARAPDAPFSQIMRDLSAAFKKGKRMSA